MENRCACVREKKVCTDKFMYYFQESSCITKCVHMISHSTYVCMTVCLFVCVFLQIYFSIDQMNKVSPAREATFTSKWRCLDPSLFMPFTCFLKMPSKGLDIFLHVFLKNGWEWLRYCASIFVFSICLFEVQSELLKKVDSIWTSSCCFMLMF